MFCHHCGAKLQNGSLFCSACGTKVSTEPANKPAAVVKKESVSSSTTGNTKGTGQKATNNNRGQDKPSVDNDTLHAVKRAIKKEMETQGITSMRVNELGRLAKAMKPPFDCTKYGFNNLTHFFKSYPELFSVSGKHVSLIKLPSEDRTITPPDEETISIVCRAMYDQTLQSGETRFSTSDLGTLFSDIPTPFKASNYGYRRLTEFFTSFPDLFSVTEEGISLTPTAVNRVSNLSPVKPVHAVTKKKHTDTITKNKNTNEPEAIGTKSVVEGTFFSYKAGDFAYMRIGTDISTCSSNDYVQLFGIDNISQVSLNYSLFSSFAPDAKKGDCIWVQLKDLIKTTPNANIYKGFVIANTQARPGLGKQITSFVDLHSVGDKLIVPINTISGNCVSVFLTPDYQAKIYQDYAEIVQYINANGPLVPVTIIDIATVNDKVPVVHLKFNNTIPEIGSVTRVTAKHINADNNTQISIADQLPASIYDVSIPVQMLSGRIDEGIAEQICKCIGESRLTESGLRRFLEERYQSAKRQKRLRIGMRKTDKRAAEDTTALSFEMDLDGIKSVPDYSKISSNGGAPVSVAFKKEKNKDSWVLNLVGITNIGVIFEHHVRIVNWKQALEDLANLALPENWDLPNQQPKVILRRYLRSIYYKSWIDGLLVDSIESSTSPRYRMFNTGLVDSNYNPIYCVLKRINPESDTRGREWELGWFGTEFSSGISKNIINTHFETMPAAPAFIHPDRLQEIFFNPDLDVSMNINHILLDNVSRLPIEFLEETAASDPELFALVEEYKNKKTRDAFSAYKKVLETKSNVIRSMSDKLKIAKEVAVKNCRWNYKTAIPIYFPRNNGLSLLLPLKLQNKRNTPADVALVVQELVTHRYQGETILDMQQSFQSARLICRPNSEWLTVENAGEETTDFEEDA